MSRISLRGILKESKEKNLQTDTRLTQPTTSKNTSNQNSSIINSPSSSNLSLTFMKDIKYPRLFNQSPQNSMLFSFNPSSTKNLQSKNNINRSSGLGSGNGTRTPSASNSYSSFKNFFQSSNKNNESKSLFGKKKLGQNKQSITIDLANNKQIKLQKKYFGHQSHNSSLSKDYKKKQINCKLNSQSTSLYNSVQNKEQNIKVYLRIKPNTDIKMVSYLQRIDQKHLRHQDKIKAYDHVFPVDSKQIQIFETVGKPILQKVIQGYNGTIFAYGQTGSGKTYTIFGQQNNHGLIPLTANYLLQNCKNQTKIEFSLLELYKQQLIDLLNNGKSELKLKETGNGVYVDGLSRISLQNIDEFINIIGQASKFRRVTTTKINQKSSRSHTILTIYLKNQQYDSKICLIDLAGSEKINKAGVFGQALEETKKINFSLSCLGNVINALVTRKKNDHIPFRDSKLTRLLKDSLSGRFKTSLIVNCSSQQGTQQESLSSLKFADRAKKVKITISKATSKNKQNIQHLHLIIKKLTSDLECTKKQLNKYKQICQQVPANIDHEVTQLTGRQSIPSQRVNINEKMKKYGKQNIVLNTKKENLDINQFTSLNVSKSITNIFGDFSGPSVSSLSHRYDENSDDLSLNFSLHRQQSNREKCQ